MKLTIIFIFLLTNFVFGQNFVITTTPTFTTTLLSFDTLSSAEIKDLKLKSNLVYTDSTLDMETHYDRNGNKIYRRCYNGHLCHLDSFFYSNKIEFHKSYDENNKLLNWYKKSISGNTIIEEYYDKEYNSQKFKQAYKRQLKFKNNKVIYRKSIDEGKLESIEHIKYDSKGDFIESLEIHYDYKKDSLINTTTIMSKKGSPTEMTHTNPKYKHYSIDTTKNKDFDYTDYNEDFIQFYDKKMEIGYLVFDKYGNIIESLNNIRLSELLLKVIYRKYDTTNNNFVEYINSVEYYNNGLIKQEGRLSNIYTPKKTEYKYEYY